MWEVVFTKQAQKDAKRLKSSNLADKAKSLVKILEEDPLRTPPPFEALKGNLAGAYSRRINIQHRLVYTIIPKRRCQTELGESLEGIVKVLSMWTHYDF